jgi:hypothetical protein
MSLSTNLAERRCLTSPPNLEGLKKKYPLWVGEHEGKEPATSPKKAELGDTVTLFEGRHTS